MEALNLRERLDWLRVWFSPGDFEVRFRRDGRTEVKGRVPRAKHGAIRQFFQHDLCPRGPTLVRGRQKRGRPPVIDVGGWISPGDRQRLRNFLIECLRL